MYWYRYARAAALRWPESRARRSRPAHHAQPAAASTKPRIDRRTHLAHSGPVDNAPVDGAPLPLMMRFQGEISPLGTRFLQRQRRALCLASYLYEPALQSKTNAAKSRPSQAAMLRPGGREQPSGRCYRSALPWSVVYLYERKIWTKPDGTHQLVRTTSSRRFAQRRQAVRRAGSPLIRGPAWSASRIRAAACLISSSDASRVSLSPA